MTVCFFYHIYSVALKNNLVPFFFLLIGADGSISGFFFFCYQQFFFFFSHTTQHNIQNTTKQNKTTDTYSTSQGSIKREGEREGQQEHKSYSFI